MASSSVPVPTNRGMAPARGTSQSKWPPPRQPQKKSLFDSSLNPY
jgi:hypothetical protein